jgi:hypothetical protein
MDLLNSSSGVTLSEDLKALRRKLRGITNLEDEDDDEDDEEREEVKTSLVLRRNQWFRHIRRSLLRSVADLRRCHSDLQRVVEEDLQNLVMARHLSQNLSLLLGGSVMTAVDMSPRLRGDADRAKIDLWADLLQWEGMGCGDRGKEIALVLSNLHVNLISKRMEGFEKDWDRGEVLGMNKFNIFQDNNEMDTDRLSQVLANRFATKLSLVSIFQTSSPSSTSVGNHFEEEEVGEETDQLVYSNIHGYRIKIDTIKVPNKHISLVVFIPY